MSITRAARLFHYLTAAIAWPLGGNLWSLRLQSVVLERRHRVADLLVWISIAGQSMGRIYQHAVDGCASIRDFHGTRDSFLSDPAVLCAADDVLFCRGFVTDQSQRYRIITMIVFLLAVLSQEITVAMGPSLLFCYLIFAKDLAGRGTSQLAVLSA